MAQQMVVEMQGLYPFGQVQAIHPDVKILVRKIVPYTKYNYSRLKDKFEIAKNIKHINLVRLLRVLQEEGRFHLIYEYVPYPVLHSPLSFEGLQMIKMKLIYMCVYLVECKIITQLRLDNLGLEHNDQIRYYLDTDFQFAYQNEHKTHSHYIDQIDHIIDELYAQNKMTQVSSQGLSKPKTSLIHKEIDGSSIRQPIPGSRSIRQDRRPIKRISPIQTSISNSSEKSRENSQQKPAPLTSRSKPITSTLELLNSIELKLDQLKENIRRHSPKQTEKSSIGISSTPVLPKLSLQQQFTEKNNIIRRQRPLDHRKYSGDVRSMQSLVQKNIADSARSVRFATKAKDKFLERIRQSTGEDDDVKAAPTYTTLANRSPQKKRPSETKKMESPKSIPKERINRRFLMEDDQESINNIKKQSKSRAKVKQLPKQPQLVISTATDLLTAESKKDINEDRKPDIILKKKTEDFCDNKKQKQLALKQRISKALKKSDEAMNRYRKLSIHTNTTEFGKRVLDPNT